jgi:ABC-type dipeptide/oligopeptide/nickel transport system permease component
VALSYLLQRLLLAIPVIVLVSLVVFGLMHFLPGDPASTMLSQFGGSAADIDRLRSELGLNDPMPVQFGRFVWSALHGDLGRSLFNRRPVVDQILIQVPSTVELAAAAMLLALVVGIPLGVLSAVSQRSWLDGAAMIVSLLGVSVPNFWLALVLILVFSLGLHWLPSTGSEGIQHLILPAVALGAASIGLVARLVRSSMLEVLRQEYMVTARSKGLGALSVHVGHGLRNSLIPVITIVGLQIGNLLAGAVVIETVFARQGIGRLLIGAIQQKDYPLVQGAVLFVTVSYVIVNVFVDWVYAVVDPRIRLGGR